jgi:hypothetical protein
MPDDAILELRNQIGKLRTEISGLGSDIRKLNTPTNELATKTKGAFGMAQKEVGQAGQAMSKMGGALGSVTGKLGSLAGMAPGIGAIGAAFVAAGVGAKVFMNVMERQERVLESALDTQIQLNEARRRGVEAHQGVAAGGLAQAADRRSVLAAAGRNGLFAVEDLEREGDTTASASSAVIAARRAAGRNQEVMYKILDAARTLRDIGAGNIAETTQMVVGTGFRPTTKASADRAARLAYGTFRGTPMAAGEILPESAASRDPLVAADEKNRRLLGTLPEVERKAAIARGTQDAGREVFAARDPETYALSKAMSDLAIKQNDQIVKLIQLVENESIFMKWFRDSFGAGQSFQSKLNDTAKAFDKGVNGSLIPPGAGSRN